MSSSYAANGSHCAAAPVAPPSSPVPGVEV